MAAVLVLEAPPDDAFHAPAREPLVQRPLTSTFMWRGAERLQRGAAHVVGKICSVDAVFCAHLLELGPRLEKAIIVSVILAGSLHCQYICRVAGAAICAPIHAWLRDRDVDA